MLVLSRQRDESIMIGDNIVITIVHIRGDKVRLGIIAPPEIPVHRLEVYKAIQRERLGDSPCKPQPEPSVLASIFSKTPPPVRPGMLVLSRKRDESIMISDIIVITIVDIRGDKVRLGIDAPTEIPVHRQEVYEAVRRQYKQDHTGTQRPAAPSSAGPDVTRTNPPSPKG